MTWECQPGVCLEHSFRKPPSFPASTPAPPEAGPALVAVVEGNSSSHEDCPSGLLAALPLERRVRGFRFCLQSVGITGRARSRPRPGVVGGSGLSR